MARRLQALMICLAVLLALFYCQTPIAFGRSEIEADFYLAGVLTTLEVGAVAGVLLTTLEVGAVIGDVEAYELPSIGVGLFDGILLIFKPMRRGCGTGLKIRCRPHPAC